VYEEGTILMGGGNRKEIMPKKRSNEKINQFCNSVGVWCVANCGGVSNVCDVA
jgi:hypothetical protein